MGKRGVVNKWVDEGGEVFRGGKAPICLYLSNIRMDKKNFGKGVDRALGHTIPSSLEQIHHNSMVQSARKGIYAVPRKNHQNYDLGGSGADAFPQGRLTEQNHDADRIHRGRT